MKTIAKVFFIFMGFAGAAAIFAALDGFGKTEFLVGGVILVVIAFSLLLNGDGEKCEEPNESVFRQGPQAPDDPNYRDSLETPQPGRPAYAQPEKLPAASRPDIRVENPHHIGLPAGYIRVLPAPGAQDVKALPAPGRTVKQETIYDKFRRQQ